MDSAQNILQIENLSKYFGGLAAVSECSLKIKKGTLIYFEKSTFDKIDVPNSLKLLKSKSVGDAEGLLLEK